MSQVFNLVRTYCLLDKNMSVVESNKPDTVVVKISGSYVELTQKEWDSFMELRWDVRFVPKPIEEVITDANE